LDVLLLLLLLGSSLDAVKRNAAETFGRLAAANGNCVRTDDQVDLLLLLRDEEEETKLDRLTSCAEPSRGRSGIHARFTPGCRPLIQLGTALLPSVPAQSEDPSGQNRVANTRTGFSSALRPGPPRV
jgi:hypothetical protein